jgi:hypothetical protein
MHLLTKSEYHTRAALLGFSFNDEHHVLHGGGVVVDADTYANVFAGFTPSMTDKDTMSKALALLDERKQYMVGWTYPPEAEDADA